MDKQLEAHRNTYESFIQKADELYKETPNIRFLIQTDETEFKETFLKYFPNNCFYNEDMPTKNRLAQKNFASSNEFREQFRRCGIHYDTPLQDRPHSALQILSAAIIMSKCNKAILSTSNLSCWTILFRKSMKGIFTVQNSIVRRGDDKEPT